MTDNLTKEQRKRAMSRVKQRDTRPEVFVRSMLHKLGFRFRKNVSSLPGKPDIVLRKYRSIIFVHGCFWHQHKGCQKSTRPLTRLEFWNSKLDKTVLRDLETIKTLRKEGWKTIVVWECELRNRSHLGKRLLRALQK